MRIPVLAHTSRLEAIGLHGYPTLRGCYRTTMYGAQWGEWALRALTVLSRPNTYYKWRRP